MKSPETLVTEEGLYWMPLSVLLQRIDDPFIDTIWDGCENPLSRDTITQCLEEGRFQSEAHNPMHQYPIAWHEERVAFLVQRMRSELETRSWPVVSEQLGSLELEVPIHSMGYAPDKPLSDGFHRLSAAIYLCLPGIWCVPGGDVFEMVRWVREGGNTPFTKDFERDFFAIHSDIDPATGNCA